jgi:threonine synthase
VTDDEILSATRHWAKTEGIFAAPEGGAALAAYRKLRATGFFKPEDTVVLFNTGTGLKYLDVLELSVARTCPERESKGLPPANAASAKPAARHIGGIIGPY